MILIKRLYDEKSDSKPVDIEELCRKIKRENYQHKASTIKLSKERSMELNVAELQRKLFDVGLVGCQWRYDATI